jgi:Family of unknown function (DUF6221)
MKREDLIDWLRAQLDTCEAKNLRVLRGDNWDWFAGSESGSERALREVQIVRKILDEVVPVMDGMDEKIGEEWNPGEPVDYSSLILLELLAAIFDDRPGFREEWRP